jgi:hypothetical protein
MMMPFNCSYRNKNEPKADRNLLPELETFCVYYCMSYYKLFTWGEWDTGGHVLRETTSGSA